MRNYELYVDDILKSIRKIEKYTKGMSYLGLTKDELTIDGIVRNLEVIGEAVKNMPVFIKEKYADIEWKKIAGLRDILAHEYYAVDLEVLWDIVKNKLPDLKKKVTLIK